MVPHELARSLQGLSSIGSKLHVKPKLKVAAPARLLARNTVEAGHKIQRFAERPSLVISQIRTHQRVSNCVVGRLFGRRQRAESVFRCDALAALLIQRLGVAVEQLLSLGLE